MTSLPPIRLSDTFHRLGCAAVVNGCASFLIFDAPGSVDPERLVPEVPEDKRVADLLAMNGWHLDHGRWVCGKHPRPVPVVLKCRSPEEVRARLLGPDWPLPRDLAEALADEIAPES